jgi:hypothetical protein
MNRQQSARDLILTWPKTRRLPVYLSTLEDARGRGDVINYRVAFPPSTAPRAFERVYMVHDGAIRGWSTFREIAYRGTGQVRDRGGGFWPEGWYIVREPDWHPLDRPLPMVGFRGFRYLEERPA